MVNDELSVWLNSKPDNVEEWLHEGLKLGCKQYNMKTGLVSKVEGEEYIIRAAYSAMGDIFSPGMKFELENTYCAAVVKSREVITYRQVGKIPTMLLHPVYVALQLESYIGAPLIKDGQVKGTLNFSSYEVRKEEFTQDDLSLITQMANKIQSVIY